MGKTVCVTGASGFIASWVVKQLLARGYIVRASVRDPETSDDFVGKMTYELSDEHGPFVLLRSATLTFDNLVGRFSDSQIKKHTRGNSPENLVKTAHLLKLPYAKERLELFRADLLEAGSFDSAIDGCDGVFHTASPVIFDATDPKVFQRDLMDPAVKGTLNVLSSCTKAKTVKRIVVTSSTAAILFSASRKPEDIVDESFFSDLEFCKRKNLWYHASKTVAEMEAWEFAKKHGLDLVTVNPAMVIGPLLQQTMNTTSEIILKFLNGAPTYPNFVVGWVDVRDVAEAHILAYETPSASGRYMCIERVLHYEEILQMLKELCPHLPITSRCEDESGPRVPVYRVNVQKLRSLGLKFTRFEESLKACVESLVENKFVKSAEI